MEWKQNLGDCTHATLREKSPYAVTDGSDAWKKRTEQRNFCQSYFLECDMNVLVTGYTSQPGLCNQGKVISPETKFPPGPVSPTQRGTWDVGAHTSMIMLSQALR